MKIVSTHLLILTLLTISCTNDLEKKPIGVASFNDILNISERIYKTGDADLFIKHADLSGMSKETIESKARLFLEAWTDNSHKKWKLKEIEVVPFDQYDPNAYIHKELAEDVRSKLIVNKDDLYNIQPTKIIFFREELKSKEKDIDYQTSKALGFAVFENKGKWYFAIRK